MTDQPTPEQLHERMRTFDSTAPDADARMRAIIVDAEAGGDAHMLAVVDALPKETTPPPPRPDDIVYDPKTRQSQYRSDDLNVSLSLDINIDGNRFIAREVVDPMAWEYRFKGDKDAFESYLRFFIAHWFGAISRDPAGYEFLRSRLFIVRPEDAHDHRVCRRTNEEDNAPWPRCVDGAVLTEPPLESPHPLRGSMMGTMFGAVVRPNTIKGACGCRCHPEWVTENVVYGLRTSLLAD